MELKKIKLAKRFKKPVLALGSQRKNTLCFIEDNVAYLSQVHQDLNDPVDYLNFTKYVKHFLKKHPKIIAYDLHPEYQSTKYAQNLNVRRYALQAVQHHHAHIASCMADNGLENQKVIGVAFDGTGLGSDNKLWGAEFLICDYKKFTRLVHLKEVPLLGQEMAILEPWRVAAIWLYLVYKERFLNLGINFVKGIDKKKWQILKNMYVSGLNSPLTSSMGRLFDAAASLVLVKYKASFEAELAIALEKIALGYRQQAQGYSFGVTKNKDGYILDPSPTFEEIVADLKSKVPYEKIAYRFHLTIARMTRKTCLVLRNNTGIKTIILSGGVFQNKLLLRLSLDLLNKAGFTVFIHQGIACNDSGISLGQALVANFEA